MLLDSYQNSGAPYVTTAKPWDTQWKEHALCDGAHQSAHQCLEFTQQEFVDMIKKHFWTVLPASLVLHHKELKLSPLGVVPQHERCPCVICNYTFFGANQDTTPTEPLEVMQFGKMLPRLLQALAYANPKYGPIYAAKCILLDSFHRLQQSLDSILPLAVLLLTPPGEDPLEALPLVVPMGWTYPPEQAEAFECMAVLPKLGKQPRLAGCNHFVQCVWNKIKSDQMEYLNAKMPMIAGAPGLQCFQAGPEFFFIKNVNKPGDTSPFACDTVMAMEIGACAACEQQKQEVASTVPFLDGRQHATAIVKNVQSEGATGHIQMDPNTRSHDPLCFCAQYSKCSHRCPKTKPETLSFSSPRPTLI